VTGRGYGTFLRPDVHSVIFTVPSLNQVLVRVFALQKLHVTANLFWVPCAEHVEREGPDSTLHPHVTWHLDWLRVFVPPLLNLALPLV